MENKNNITKELKEIRLFLSDMKKIEVYSVPPSYFDNLSDKIINKINLHKERASFSQSSVPYSFPADYFNNLCVEILKKVISEENTLSKVFEETEAIAPLLNTISKKQVYNVPAGFFETLQLPLAITQKERAKVVSLKRKSRFFRFAAAAVLIPAVAIGLYTLTGKEIINLQSDTSNARNKVKNLSKEEIVSFLKNNTLIEDAASTRNTSSNDKKIKSSLKQVSDKEIQQFLKEIGESDEI